MAVDDDGDVAGGAEHYCDDGACERQYLPFLPEKWPYLPPKLLVWMLIDHIPFLVSFCSFLEGVCFVRSDYWVTQLSEVHVANGQQLSHSLYFLCSSSTSSPIFQICSVC